MSECTGENLFVVQEDDLHPAGVRRRSRGITQPCVTTIAADHGFDYEVAATAAQRSLHRATRTSCPARPPRSCPSARWTTASSVSPGRSHVRIQDTYFVAGEGGGRLLQGLERTCLDATTSHRALAPFPSALRRSPHPQHDAPGRLAAGGPVPHRRRQAAPSPSSSTTWAWPTSKAGGRGPTPRTRSSSPGPRPSSTCPPPPWWPSAPRGARTPRPTGTRPCGPSSRPALRPSASWPSRGTTT